VSRVGLTTANFLDRLIDPAVKLGTSTPKADPSGDYAWAMFRRADAVRPGATRSLALRRNRSSTRIRDGVGYAAARSLASTDSASRTQ
jgi:ABC-type molybdate transport system substrate-binding protein